MNFYFLKVFYTYNYVRFLDHQLLTEHYWTLIHKIFFQGKLPFELICHSLNHSINYSLLFWIFSQHCSFERKILNYPKYLNWFCTSFTCTTFTIILSSFKIICLYIIFTCSIFQSGCLSVYVLILFFSSIFLLPYLPSTFLLWIFIPCFFYILPIGLSHSKRFFWESPASAFSPM